MEICKKCGKEYNSHQKLSDIGYSGNLFNWCRNCYIENEKELNKRLSLAISKKYTIKEISNAFN